MGQVKNNMIISIFGVIMQLSLNLILIPAYGVVGLAITSIIVYSLMAFALLLVFNKKYHVSKATIYNTIEIFLDAGLIRKHQFGEKTLSSSSYEKSYFDKQHDHLVIYKDGSDKEIEEIIEFCDPRIQGIKQSIEEAFGVKIDNHSLYFYGHKKK